MSAAFEHHPVMVREVIELLMDVPKGIVIDATVGGGGHARALLGARDDLRLLGTDRDAAAVAAARATLREFGDRALVVHGGFEKLESIVEEVMVRTQRLEGDVVGILFDLGVSSPQLDQPERGFSYWADAPLDMRMDSGQELTAAVVVNTYDERALAHLISENGDEKFAQRIAARIVQARPVQTTGELVEIVKSAIPAAARRRGRHPARKTFQAIRMEVNRELPNLADGLEESVHLLAPGGRLLVMAYHSLEDRMVKQRFAQWSGATERAQYVPKGLPPAEPSTEPVVRVLTKKPLRPRSDEVTTNPRAESARLRAAERLAGGQSGLDAIRGRGRS